MAVQFTRQFKTGPVLTIIIARLILSSGVPIRHEQTITAGKRVVRHLPKRFATESVLPKANEKA